MTDADALFEGLVRAWRELPGPRITQGAAEDLLAEAFEWPVTRVRQAADELVLAGRVQRGPAWWAGQSGVACIFLTVQGYVAGRRSRAPGRAFSIT